ncbi:MAG: NAD(P)H-dependent oxidoreductase [Desulfomonile tiedjei]|nr:NAD(P)H-dependent oxidoreductase [Desulfomonile tiedjei]
MGNESQREERAGLRPTKGQQIFLYVAPFPALAFFKVWASFGRETGSLLIVACAMFVYCVLVLVLARHWDKPTYFDRTVCAYFFLVAASLALWPQAAGAILTDYAVTGIYLCLFVTAFIPPVLGFEPFTYHYAKKQTPQVFWDNAIFVEINRIMTFAWAGIFAVCVVLSLYPWVVTRAIIPIALIVGVGLPFNLLFPDYYLKRLGFPAMAKMRSFANPAVPETAAVHQPSAISRVAATPAVPPEPNPPRAAFATEAGPPARSPLKKEAIMKVIAINSSPRGSGTSKTMMMLDALVGGMREAGAEVETVHLRQKKVKNCIGCFTCWTKTPGVCIHKDDMTSELFPKWLEADLAVYATPLYHYTVNAAMKAFIERTLPVLEPFMYRDQGTTHHPLRRNVPQAVVLSVAGFPEASVFAQLSSYVNFLFRRGLVAEIYRPGAEMMTQPEVAETTKDILEATAQAGRELVQSKKIAQTTLERITRPVGDDFDTFAKMANVFWKTCIQEGLTPAEFETRNLVPRPDSVETFILVMTMGFNPEGAAGVRGVMQFNFSGEVNGSCYLKIENGSIEGKEGTADHADLTVEAPFEVWMDIVTGKADGQQMFMQQKYKPSGDLSLLLRMKDLFGKGKT